MKLSIAINFVIQCYMTSTINSSNDLFSSLSSNYTVDVFITLLRITHRFYIVGVSSDKPKGKIWVKSSA